MSINSKHMRYIYIILSFFFVTKGKVRAQSSVKADLINLTNLTFKNNPSIKRNFLIVSNAEGSWQIQKSIFDYELTSDLSFNKNNLFLFTADPRNQYISGKLKSNNSSVSIAMRKKLRSGQNIRLGIDYLINNDNLPINQFNQNIDPYLNNLALTSTLSLTQPLLRGRSKKINTALEKISLLNIESSRDNNKLANANEIFQMITAYWQYVSSYKKLNVYKQNEKRVQKVMELTQELIKADKKPAAELIQVEADLANQKRQKYIAEQTFFNSKINLGREIGLSEKESNQLSNPLDEFPSIKKSGFTESLDINYFLNLAQENRKDIEALIKIEESLKLQLDLAINNRKPQLDATGYLKYGGRGTGNIIGNSLSTFSNKQGRTFEIGLTLSLLFPVNNNKAIGTYIQNQVALNDQTIQNKDLQRNINMNVSIAYNNLKKSVSILKKAELSFNSYKEVYNNERIKFKNGLTTLLSLTLFQERLTRAEVEYLNAQQQFANTIAHLRYETGTLINKNIITKDTFYTIPKS